MLVDLKELLNVQFFPFNFVVKKCRGFLRRNEAVIEAAERTEEGSDIRDSGITALTGKMGDLFPARAQSGHRRPAQLPAPYTTLSQMHLRWIEDYVCPYFLSNDIIIWNHIKRLSQLTKVYM